MTARDTESESGKCTSDTERIQCVECGAELTDPKNAGDPDVNGDWVCRSEYCRGVHEVEMTVNLGELFG